MHTELYSVSKIFTENLFRIPDYQRGFAWTERQLKDFWSDIEQLDVDKDHYTGVLTFEEVPTQNSAKWDDDIWIIESKKYRAYYVVDGQQRLTTIILLLQALIEQLPAGKKLNFTSADKITEKFIFESKNEGISRSYLFGYEKDNPSYEFLKRKIFGENSNNYSAQEETIYTNNLAKAKAFFKGKLKEFDIKKLEEVYTKVTQHLLFNIYTISKEIDVFVAFETMNNRGKPLSHLELLKNRLIFLSTRMPGVDAHDRLRIRKTINDSWKTVYHTLGMNPARQLNDDYFLWIHYQNYFAADIKKIADSVSKGPESWRWREFDHFKTFLLDQVFSIKNLTAAGAAESGFQVDSKFINTYALNLKRGVEIVSDLLNPEISKNFDDENERLWLDRLNRLGSSAYYPLIYAIYAKKVDIKTRMEMLKCIEFIAFAGTLWGNIMLRRNEADFQPMALRFCTDELDVHGLETQLKNSVDALKAEIATATLGDIAKDKGYYGWSAVKYFLYEYEQHLRLNSKAEREKISWDEYSEEKFGEDYSSVEHIYPQKPTDEDWLKPFKGFSVKQRTTLRHSLGNLLPLSKPKNSSLRNKPFKEKKGSSSGSIGYCYGGYCENEVACETEWGAASILLRGIKLLEFMERRWGMSFGDKTAKTKQLGLDFVLSSDTILQAKIRSK